MDHDERKQRAHRAPRPGAATRVPQPAAGTPGKQTLVEAARPAIARARGNAGAPLPVELRLELERTAGLSLEGVRVHDGPEAAEAAAAVGARAFAIGQDLHFAAGEYRPGSPDGRLLIAHEVAHAIQDRGNTRPGEDLEVSDRHDASEREADAFAQAFAAGTAAPAVTASRGGVRMVYRWESDEHRWAGDVGSGGLRYHWAARDRSGARIAGPYKFTLTHGDIVMLAADYLGVDEYGKTRAKDSLLGLASRVSGDAGKQVGTQDEIVCALHSIDPHDPRFAPDGIWAGITFSKEVEAAVRERYRARAMDNIEHFARPHRGSGTRVGEFGGRGHSATGSYRALHEAAIRCAIDAARTGGPVDEALLYEAQAQHYLTDAFSAGHVRTARASIKDWWDQRTPGFHDKFVTWAVNGIATWAMRTSPSRGAVHAALGAIAGDHVMLAAFKSAVRAKLEALTGKLRIGFGDVISLAAHDMDNEIGLDLVNSDKQPWYAHGDGRLLARAQKRTSDGVTTTTFDEGDAASRKMMTLAVERGIDDIHRAYARGGRGTEPDYDGIMHGMMTVPPDGRDALYAAEMLIPMPAKPFQGPETWRVESLDALYAAKVRTDRPTTYGEKIATVLGPEGVVGRAFAEVELENPKVMGITLAFASQAFENAVAKRFASGTASTRRALDEIIATTPERDHVGDAARVVRDVTVDMLRELAPVRLP